MYVDDLLVFTSDRGSNPRTSTMQQINGTTCQVTMTWQVYLEKYL